MNGTAFVAVVEQVPAPTLRPGNVMVMDDLLAHKRVAGEGIERASAELRFLPAYSPDFYPIEMAFSKLKAYLKTVAVWTKEALWEAIHLGVDAIISVGCVNFFQPPAMTVIVRKFLQFRVVLSCLIGPGTSAMRSRRSAMPAGPARP